MSTTTDTAYAVTAEQLASYERDGFLLAKGLLHPQEVRGIGAFFDELGEKGESLPGHWIPDTTPEGSKDPLKRYPRVMMPHRFDKLSRRYLLDTRVHDVLAALFGDEPVAAQSMFYFKPPGARGQALHQDNFYLHVKPGTCVAAWAAIDPVTPDNGGLYVIPGTHKLDIICPEAADEGESFTTHLVKDPNGRKAVPVLMDAGDVLFFNGSLIHGSPPNRSATQWRRSFICHYLPKTSATVSKFYKPLLSFDDKDVSQIVNDSTDGGPCGKEFTGAGSYGKWH